MIDLLGHDECKIDTKGRLRLPKDLVTKLPEDDRKKFVLNRGLDNYIALYPYSVWKKESARVNKLNRYKRQNREFKRAFFRGATTVDVDSNGRILIPKRLLDFGEIEKEIVMISYGEDIEIWAKHKYEDNSSMASDDFSDMAEDVLGTDIDDLQ